MTIQPVTIQVSPDFAAKALPEPQPNSRVTVLATLAAAPETRDQLTCQRLLVGETRVRAQKEASDIWAKIQANTQVLAAYGTSALDSVNQLNDQMLNGRPPVNVPELREAMTGLSRKMRGIGKKYDPSDDKVLKRYEQAKDGVMARIRFGKTFLEAFLDDIRSLQQQFEQVIHTLEGKQFGLLKNVAYYDQYYLLRAISLGADMLKVMV